MFAVRAVARFLKVAVITACVYFCLFCMPAITHTWFEPGANNNGYSPYTMFERCHAAHFNIGQQTC